MTITISYGDRVRYCLKGASKSLPHMLPGIILEATLEFVVLINDVRILGQSFIPNLQAWRLVENQALVRPCPGWLCFMITNSKTPYRAVVPGLSSSHSFTHTVLVVWQCQVLVTLEGDQDWLACITTWEWPSACFGKQFTKHHLVKLSRHTL